MLLKTEHFTSGENSTQYYRFFKNEVTGDLVQIIRNKKEPCWFGYFMNDKTDQCRLIPVYGNDDPDELLNEVCIWYNMGMPVSEKRDLPKPTNTSISKLLREMEDMFGKFPLQAAMRIQRYLDNPSVDYWDDICGIIINGDHTVWQCVSNIDPSFPKEGRTTDITGKIVEEWLMIPTTFNLLRAIKDALKLKDAVETQLQ
ncbi:hypothetical protein [Paenibacillus periandrae]|uniref:hypothetical protein n=1 Tax=Paenibacillus periandrae TaxID=1761741 RepID=UPI001F098311|nr:hypothetical protein [Paenibacillus periandrae]